MTHYFVCSILLTVLHWTQWQIITKYLLFAALQRLNWRCKGTSISVQWRVGGLNRRAVLRCRIWQISDAVNVRQRKAIETRVGPFFGFKIFSIDLAQTNEAESYSSWWFVMYEWIVDGLSSLFVPFSVEKSAAWPSEHGNGVARAAGTDTQRLENSNVRPAKRNYQRCAISLFVFLVSE